MRQIELAVMGLAVVTLVLLAATTSFAATGDRRSFPEPTQCQGQGEQESPSPPALGSQRPRGAFDDEYIFAITRGVNDSDMYPAVKIFFFPVTISLDIALLPFEVLGGLIR